MSKSSLTGKWLELLKEVAPGIKRVAFVFDPKLAPGEGSYYTRLIQTAAPNFAVARNSVARFAVRPRSSVLLLNLFVCRTAASLCCRTPRPWSIAG